MLATELFFKVSLSFRARSGLVGALMRSRIRVAFVAPLAASLLLSGATGSAASVVKPASDPVLSVYAGNSLTALAAWRNADLRPAAAYLRDLVDQAEGMSLRTEPGPSALAELKRYFRRSPQVQLATHDTVSGHLAAAASALEDRLESGWIRQISLPQNRLVLYYGNPFSAALGPLGAYSDPELVRRLRDQAAAYQRLDPAHPVVMGFDYVTPVAQPWPMSDGSWVSRMPNSSIQHYLDLARANHFLFFFDMELGHSPINVELDRLARFLDEPEVGIALDPEFDMPKGAIPGRTFGRMSAAEINRALSRLSNLVVSRDLPPKFVIIHQFLDSMLPDREAIKSYPGVTVIICIDGVGPAGSKIADYRRFITPSKWLGGFKLFYRSDHPLMSEAAVLALRPAPVMVMYQ
jgi:hypothetical protein